MSDLPDAIVIGGGAAGLFCALTAAGRGRSVLLLEQQRSVGSKIRISGGGRCNFTNLLVGAENFVSENPHFCKSALARFTPDDFIALMQKHEIPFYEKEKGQLFCSDRADRIIAMLLQECNEAGVRIMTGINVSSLEKSGETYLLETDAGPMKSRALVVATGGLSLAEIGATDYGFRIARQFGLRIFPPRPALVPLTLGGAERTFAEQLSGVSLDAVVSTGDFRLHGSLLFTHRGLSGPVILQLSLYWRPGEGIEIDLLPEDDFEEQLRAMANDKTELHTCLARFLPARFAKAWCEMYVATGFLNTLSAKELQLIIHKLRHWTLHPTGTEGYRKAEVTAGGVSTDELSSRTMECRKVNGLYFIGEVVDVTGQLGGYNFQWAWASGHAAGNAV